jgi:hypothetical protein
VGCSTTGETSTGAMGVSSDFISDFISGEATSVTRSDSFGAELHC